MPKADERVNKFQEWSKMLSPPFVMYADIEAILLPPEDELPSNLQTHEPCTVGSYIVPHKDLAYQPADVVFHEGRECVEEFCIYLDRKCRELYNYSKQHCNKPQLRTREEVIRFEAATECEYCHRVFDEVGKVWHHGHISGKLLATVCQRCNTRIRQPMTYLPVFFHNLKNYDMHALCREGLANMPLWRLKPIAVTKEKYITLTAKFEVDRDAKNKPIFFEIRFIDSFQFLTASLDKLSSSLDRNKMKHSLKMRDRYDLDDDIMFSKGVFPYSYLDNVNKLHDLQLPPIASFFDMLSNSLRTTPEEYARAQKAWRQFNCLCLDDYLKCYLEMDCRLLADVFENFRATTIRETCLDPANYITLPQYTFAAAFRKTQCELLIDEDMYEFFEDGIRGGMTFVNTHHVVASNPETGDPNGSTYIAYWDANNLYGNALRQK